MIARTASVLATSLLIPVSLAQQSSGNYTVWGSVVFVRAGDRTPLALGNNETLLTSLGASQLTSVGNFFRSRYIETATSSTQDVSAPLAGLNANYQDDIQTYVLALDEQYTAASAQAFMQGFYPPSALNSTSAASTLQPSNVLANGSYLENPIGGYNLPHVRTAGGLDVNYIYVAGDLDCPAIDVYADNVINVDQLVSTTESSQHIYNDLQPYLDPVLGRADQTFSNAWNIYDYMSYLYTHNSTVYNAMQKSPFSNEGNNVTAMDALRLLGDQQQYSFLGNLTAGNPYNRKPESATVGSISTIAGATLSLKIIEQLATLIATAGQEYKLSVLVGDYDPMLSFFALANLTNLNWDFTGLPTYGSAMVFELFSYSSSSSFPATTSDLNVRFSFRNGTGPATDFYPSNPSTFESSAPSGLQTFPLFGRSPSQEDMSWTDFIAAMSQISIADPGDWCQQCGATNLFCAAWNSSDAAGTTNQYGYVSSSKGQSSGISGPVAGVIGAIIALALSGLAALILFFVAGFGVKRTRDPLWVSMKGRKHDLGGFKGSNKLASDPDLVRSAQPVAKGGAVVGASVEKNGHDDGIEQNARERVGSWEMSNSGHGKMFGNLSPKTNDAEASGSRGRFSVESDRADPFRDPAVEPIERV